MDYDNWLAHDPRDDRPDEEPDSDDARDDYRDREFRDEPLEPLDDE